MYTMSVNKTTKLSISGLAFQ